MNSNLLNMFQVYDVTQYLEYHPGGMEELMRAAGTDATELFNEHHMWVNHGAMLKSCVVGRFNGDRNKRELLFNHSIYSHF
jgi:cytochrome-b5 reductase